MVQEMTVEYDLEKAIPVRGQGSDAPAALRGIAIDEADSIYAAVDASIGVYESGGTLERQWATAKAAHGVAVDAEGLVHVGEYGQVERFTRQGKLVGVLRDERLGLVTTIGFSGKSLLLADASHRAIRRYDRGGKFLNDIGKDNPTRGFMIPNGHLDFAVDSDGIIHAASSGKHRVERYNVDGKLLGRFGKFTGRNAVGFSGCCNPTNIALLEGGDVVVTVKVPPRAKIYDSTGKLLALVGVGAFEPNCKNMDVAVDSRGRIHVVDTVKSEILVFVPGKEEALAAPPEAESKGGRER